jgi:hypothetical protein
LRSIAHHSSSGTRASVGKKVRSEAKYEDVKQFFLEALKNQGWAFESEKTLINWKRNQGGRELKWRKADYNLSIEYSGQAGYEWTYAIGIQWYGR